MKKLWLLGVLMLSALSCSVDEEQTSVNENLTASTTKEFRGVFTTLDGSKRAKVYIEIPRKGLALARFEVQNGETFWVKSITKPNTFSTNDVSKVIVFENESIHFEAKLESLENYMEITQVSFFGKQGDIIVLPHSTRAPVTPVTGTYECGSCNGHPVLGNVSQTFNMIFSVADGTGAITTQSTLGATIYNGIGFQDNCVANGNLTSCELESGDGSTTTTGHIANGNPVTWMGSHTFNNEPSGANDCSGVNGTWQWQSNSYGFITGTFISDADCSVTLVEEDFEDALVTYAISVAEFTDGNSDYFLRTDGSNISSNVNFNAVSGTSFFAAQDIDGEVASPEQNLLFSAIPVSTVSTITFSALFAEDDDAANQDWDNTDFLIVEYSFDGGSTWTPIFAIENDGATFNSAPLIDTNLDGTGDGPEITDTFTQYSASFQNSPITNPTASPTVDIRIRMSVDAGDEDIAFDDILIKGL